MVRCLSRLLPSFALAMPAMAAAAATPQYRATFAAPVERSPIIAKELLWSCKDRDCTAAPSNSRPAIVCAALARSAGRLTAFSIAGTAFDPSALEKCNASAS